MLEPSCGHFCLSPIECERKIRLGNISVTMDTGMANVVAAHWESNFMYVFMCIQ